MQAAIDEIVTKFGGGMVQTPHPAYRTLMDGFNKSWKKEVANLPGGKK